VEADILFLEFHTLSRIFRFFKNLRQTIQACKKIMIFGRTHWQSMTTDIFSLIQ
jgi:hypothetical protein